MLECKNKIQELGIPLTEVIDSFDSVDDLINYVRPLRDLEGFVIEFENGHRLKIKCDYYVRIHKNIDKVKSDKNIVELIINNQVDDVLAMLPEKDQKRVFEFVDMFWKLVEKKISELRLLYQQAMEQTQGDRKSIAVEFVPKLKNSDDAKFIFMMLKGLDAGECVMNYIKNNISSTRKWDSCRQWLENL